MAAEKSDSAGSGQGKWFATTQWSVVVAAGHTRAPGHEDALAHLCEVYWYPVYVYIRRRGAATEEARDLTQGFFADLLGRKSLKAAQRERGKFRTFLLTAARNYVTNEHDRAVARKRGGDLSIRSLDFEEAESRYAAESPDVSTPEKLYQRRWARTVLDETLERLRDEVARGANAERSLRLVPFLTAAESTGTYREVAGELEMSEGAVKVSVHRLRKRYGKLLREEVGRTLDDPAAVDEEIRQLFAALE